MNNHQNSIARTIKDENHPYVIVDKTFLKGNNLSWKAKGILTYFMSLPNNWNINMNEIQTRSSDGLTSFWNGIKELKKAGYIHHGIVRDSKKRIKKHVYLVRENLHIGFPNVAFQDIENVHLLNNEYTNKGKKVITNSRAFPKRDGASEFDKIASTKLKEIITSKININIHIASWPNTFRLLRTKDKVSKDRIKRVIKWYARHIGEDYVPVAHSAKAFREKFTRLEEAIKRYEHKEVQKEHGSMTYRRGADGEYGYYDDTFVDEMAYPPR